MILKLFFRKAIMVLFVFLCCLIWSKLVDCYSHSHRLKPQALGESHSHLKAGLKYNRSEFDLAHKKHKKTKVKQTPSSKFDDLLLRYVFNLKRTDKVRCREPSVEYLEDRLAFAQILFQQNQEKIYKDKFTTNYLNSTPKLILENDLRGHVKSVSHLVENTGCNSDTRNLTCINCRSICPWKYVVYERPNKFPILRSEAVCTCSNCTGAQNDVLHNYSCVPVFKLEPVLVRTDCDPTSPENYYDWVPEVEEVSVACVCALKAQLGPVSAQTN